MKNSKKYIALILSILLLLLSLSPAAATESLRGTGWWNAGNQTGSNVTWDGSSPLVFTIEALSDGGAFNIEIFDSTGKYLTWGSNSDAWYFSSGSVAAGITHTDRGGSKTIKAGKIYSVTWERSGASFTITYKNITDDEVIYVTKAANSSIGIAGNVSAHFIAQIGSYRVSTEDIFTIKDSAYTRYIPEGGEPLTLTAGFAGGSALDGQISWSSSTEKAATVSDGVVTPVSAGSATIKAVYGSESSECTVVVTGSPAENENGTLSFSGLTDTMTYQTVHDPSIVKGYTRAGDFTVSKNTIIKGEPDETYNQEIYFIYGSHMAFAYSWDLMNWTMFTNNINDDFKTLLADEISWSERGDNSYVPDGNLWAPDVIWNKEMQKWCMYLSVNGTDWHSCIALLTSDSLSGDWKHEGTVVYSGFTGTGTTNDFKYTDYEKVTGDSSLPSRYLLTESSGKISWNRAYGAHAIDPCVTYDDEGNLWMSYGSWSGGIWLFRLDNKTGLRDYSVTYPYENGTTDPYMGYRLAGGSQRTGEASYIEKIGDYYYLFITYGGLASDGGYSMRTYRSDKITGPYTDVGGANGLMNAAVNGNRGNLLMFYYKWSSMSQGYVAQGHNSAFVDDDGRAFLVYHTRFSNRGEAHQVRVHQLFTSENGWLLCAPYSYTGESLGKDITANDIQGEYEVIFHDVTDYENKVCNESQSLILKADGTISGAKSGTWSISSSGAPYVNMTINSEKYEGVVLRQRKELKSAVNASIGKAYGIGDETIVFTLINTKTKKAAWGSQNVTAASSIELDSSTVYLTPDKYYTLSATISPEYTSDKTISWSSSKPSVATVDAAGRVHAVTAGDAVITAKTANGKSAKCTVHVEYTDVTKAANPYYYNPVYWAVGKSITFGFEDEDGYRRTFGPEQGCTREQMVTFLWRLAGKPEPASASSPFTDVAKGAYYYKAVLWAAEQGITKGYEDGTFGVGVTCLREHAVTFLYRFKNKPKVKSRDNRFTDVSESDYFYLPVLWAAENGITKGYPDDNYKTFRPENTCLREHIVTFMYRAEQ